MKILIVLTFILNISIQAQDKISNNDLRHLKEILSISFNKSESLKLLKSKLDQYYLQSSINKKNSSIKIANNEFKKVDDTFVKDFINMKYMMLERPKDCTSSHSLFMRGETLTICKVEKEKNKKVQNLISLIQKLNNN